MLPGGGLGGELRDTLDAAVEALGRQHADLDLDHVEPAGVFGNVVELQSAQQAARLWRREGLVERPGGVGGQIIEDNADTLGLWEVQVGKFAHAGGEVDCGPALGDLDLAPGPMNIEKDGKMNRLAVPLRLYSQS